MSVACVCVCLCQRVAVGGVAMGRLVSWSVSPAIWTVREVLSLHTLTTPEASPLASNWGLQGRAGEGEGGEGEGDGGEGERKKV